MDRSLIEVKIGDIVASMGRVPRETVDSRQWIASYGIDSLAQLVFRETLERVLQVHLPDDVWADLGSLNDLADYIHRNRVNGSGPVEDRARDDHGRQAPTSSGPRLTRSGLLVDRLVIGMPLTGRNNLAETPLLKYAGDLRWRHISAVAGVPSKDIVDAEGHRLYATFFYVDVAFPESKPMAAYGENDELSAVSSMSAFGESLLDGFVFLEPNQARDVDAEPFSTVEAATAAGVPAVRLSNIFVKQFSGAAWLKRSRPASPGFRNIRSLTDPPNSYAWVKEAEKQGTFASPSDRYVPLTNGVCRYEYALAPDRDLNGAGLVYFANYPLFADIAERDGLRVGERALTDDLLDRRTLVRRRSAYLNNASSRDALLIETQAWLENPFLNNHPTPELAPIRLLVNSRIFRKSDGRMMYVSTAEKIIYNGTLDEVPFFETLERGMPASS
jgi:probable biosynthetic protein (TIGR04098 family)